MNGRRPAEIGMSLAEVETPALLIDLDAYEANLDRLALFVAGRPGLRLRPHAKTHKSPIVALHQVQRGAVGVCCQKVGEAEALVEGGVRDVLVTNEIVGAGKLRRLAGLAKLARIGACVDDPRHVVDLGIAARSAGVTLDVYVEIDVGSNRCGVAPGEAAVALARAIQREEGLAFAGLQSYHGRAQHVRARADRVTTIAGAAAQTAATRAALAAAGIACRVVTGAGTGTFALEAGSGVWDELQCGSYIFMDADYGRNLDEDGTPIHGFEHALFVLATVMSRPIEARAVVDAGLKALAVDAGLPLLPDFPKVEFTRIADEHGTLAITSPTNGLAIGDKVRLIPGHCDPTVNLHDWYVGVRGDRVEAVWPIAARGAMF